MRWRRLGERLALLLFPGLETVAGYALAQAAILEKVLLQPFDLLVDEVVGLMNEAERDVGHGLRRPGFNEFAVELIGLGCLATEPTNIVHLLGVLGPNAQIT